MIYFIVNTVVVLKIDTVIAIAKNLIIITNAIVITKLKKLTKLTKQLNKLYIIIITLDKPDQQDQWVMLEQPEVLEV